MAFISIRSTSPEATSTASPAEEVRSKFRCSRSPCGISAGRVNSDATPRGRLARRPSPATRAAIAAAPRCKRSASRRASRAQRCAARGIRAERLVQENGRIRVPSVITNKMIMVVIEEAAKTFKVPVSAIYESNIHNLLKNRQVVVRN